MPCRIRKFYFIFRKIYFIFTVSLSLMSGDAFDTLVLLKKNVTRHFLRDILNTKNPDREKREILVEISRISRIKKSETVIFKILTQQRKNKVKREPNTFKTLDNFTT